MVFDSAGRTLAAVPLHRAVIEVCLFSLLDHTMVSRAKHIWVNGLKIENTVVASFFVEYERLQDQRLIFW